MRGPPLFRPALKKSRKKLADFTPNLRMSRQKMPGRDQMISTSQLASHGRKDHLVWRSPSWWPSEARSSMGAWPGKASNPARFLIPGEGIKRAILTPPPPGFHPRKSAAGCRKPLICIINDKVAVKNAGKQKSGSFSNRARLHGAADLINEEIVNP